MVFKKGHKLSFKNRTIYKNCPICNGQFKTFISINKKFCSKQCLSIVRKKQMTGNNFAKGNKLTDEHKKKIAEFISRTRSGENNPNWKGGVKRQYKILYGSKMYKEWRKAVFERDNFTCQWCGEKKYIEAHHVKEWANYPDLRFVVNNGLTLCKTCHNKTKYGKYTKFQSKRSN